MKIFEIKSCIDCPVRYYTGGYYAYCEHDNIKSRKLPYPLGDIPEWCPLPDKEGIQNDRPRPAA